LVVEGLPKIREVSALWLKCERYEVSPFLYSSAPKDDSCDS